MIMERIIYKQTDKISRITINYPEKLNCLDIEMLKKIADCLLRIKEDKDSHVLIIQGAGDKAFSTGGNLKEFGALKDFHDIKDWIKFGNEVFNILDDMPITTIAEMRGYAMGGGLELAMACDLRFASENAIFAMPELNHGWVPGWGGLSRLRRLVGESKAKEMILLGERVDASTAANMGLINKTFPEHELDKKVKEYADQISKVDPFVIEMSKNALMNQSKSTWGSDLLYDALATYYSVK